MDILIIMGPPYSGKGTQCEILKDKLSYKHISTGDRCRYEKEQKTEIGIIMSRFEEKGDLVPDKIMKDLFSKILDENINNNGIILDGYPRTINQVNDLIDLVDSKQLSISKVLNIELPKEELLKRAAKRAKSSNRLDDKNPDTHIKRILVFEQSTLPAVKYLSNHVMVTNINGMGSIDEITRKINSSL